MHFSTGRGMVYLVEFTPTTQGEDDGNPLRCPEKDEDLLRQKLEKNLEGPARVVLDCPGSRCP